MHADLAHIDTWIFDLDNSLYPASANLFSLIDIRMGEYIERLLSCDSAEARRVQKRHFLEHGTTLAGLMATHGVDPHDFLDYVHDIDLARISADPALVRAIDRLPGRKYIFTNASADYAARVLERLGLANLWDGMHDIHAMDYVPKPHPASYAALCEAHAIDPSRALFVEDMARNLKPAKALGMTTVWIDNGSESGGHDADPAFIDYRIADIGVWLTEILGDKRR
ncbi:pyrimidine 5'-nucleotidase [Allosphingosinicella flava]|uniref:Pyrimidine 5'-nucleotidase n=1 Tax=Allosphingosinicella flava TaxID=2771430 RepID=A0A7T2GIS8_9SPHN|nr:pyrimidine 5'-nucleotidase [Sphingosinicella flava]QPQ54642.1 pyrimidine 5'-nucleotidase [Sphingosinicella flava]